MARIGYYGGSFNPPTKAHIGLAKKAINECNLYEVIFVPVGDSYEKQGIIKGIHRYNMLELACKGENNRKVSDIEIKSNKDYKAIDIFEILQNEHKEDENFFLMGTDNLKNILFWKEAERLVSNFNYIIFDRNIDNAKNIIEDNELLSKNKRRFKIISNKKFNECSSTDIREELKKGNKPKNLDDRVYEYIKENNIYYTNN